MKQAQILNKNIDHLEEILEVFVSYATVWRVLTRCRMEEYFFMGNIREVRDVHACQIGRMPSSISENSFIIRAPGACRDVSACVPGCSCRRVCRDRAPHCSGDRQLPLQELPPAAQRGKRCPQRQVGTRKGEFRGRSRSGSGRQAPRGHDPQVPEKPRRRRRCALLLQRPRGPGGRAELHSPGGCQPRVSLRFGRPDLQLFQSALLHVALVFAADRDFWTLAATIPSGTASTMSATRRCRSRETRGWRPPFPAWEA